MEMKFLQEDELQDGKEYYIYLKYVKSYKEDLLEYLGGPYIDKENIDQQIDDTKENRSNNEIDIHKILLEKILSGTVAVTTHKIDQKVDLYIENEDDIQKVKDHLTPDREYNDSFDIYLKQTLIDFYESLEETDEDDEPISLEQFDSLPIYTLYQDLHDIIQEVKAGVIFNYKYQFNKAIALYLSNKSIEDLNNLHIGYHINCLNELLEDINEECKENHHSILYNDLLSLSQKIDGIPISQDNLGKETQILYNTIQSIGKSISGKDKKEIEDYEKSIGTDEEQEYLDNPANKFLDQLYDSIYSGLGSMENIILFSLEIENIVCSFGGTYLYSAPRSPKTTQKTKDILEGKSNKEIEDLLQDALDIEDFTAAVQYRDELSKRRNKQSS